MSMLNKLEHNPAVRPVCKQTSNFSIQMADLPFFCSPDIIYPIVRVTWIRFDNAIKDENGCIVLEVPEKMHSTAVIHYTADLTPKMHYLSIFVQGTKNLLSRVQKAWPAWPAKKLLLGNQKIKSLSGVCTWSQAWGCSCTMYSVADCNCFLNQIALYWQIFVQSLAAGILPVQSEQLQKQKSFRAVIGHRTSIFPLWRHLHLSRDWAKILKFKLGSIHFRTYSCSQSLFA